MVTKARDNERIRVLRRFRDPIYRRTYTVLTGSNLEELCEWLRRHNHGIFEPDTMLFAVGQTFSTRFRCAFWYDFTCTPEMAASERVAVVTHECLHGALGLFRRIGDTHMSDPGAEEPLAYLVEWLVRQHVDLVLDGAELDPNAKKRKRR